MSNYFINPYLFFFIKEGVIVCWDYKNHQQFELTTEYFLRLVEFANKSDVISKVDNELIEAKLISSTEKDIEWKWDILSKIFHIGTQNIPFFKPHENYDLVIQDYMQFCEEASVTAPSMDTNKNGIKIELPPPNFSLFSKKDFWSVLKERKTCRSFDGSAISLEQIATLLFATFGRVHSEWSDLKNLGLSELSFRKTSPSAGGLHSSEAYLIALNISGLDYGIYHYQSHTHSLIKIDELKGEKIPLGALLMEQHFSERLSAGIFITARLEKNWHKYHHSRGYNHVLLDIGHLSQTFQLCSTAMDLHAWLTGGFLDDEVSELLKIKSSTEYPFFFVGVGHGDGNSLSQEMLEYLKK